jgi:hypothetical protein
VASDPLSLNQIAGRRERRRREERRDRKLIQICNKIKLAFV